MGDVKTGNHCYIVRGGGCWGKGWTEEQAITAWRNAGGTGRKRDRDYEVTRIELPCRIYVDDVGTARYEPVTPTEPLAFLPVPALDGGPTWAPHQRPRK